MSISSVMLPAIVNRHDLTDQDRPPRPRNDEQGQTFCMKPEGHDGEHRYDELEGLDELAPPPSKTMH